MSGGRPATQRLKLASPWIVSTIQTATQIGLGQPLPPSQLDNGRMCVCPDVNFLILRTSVAYALPLVLSVTLLFLAAHKLRHYHNWPIDSERHDSKGVSTDNTRGNSGQRSSLSVDGSFGLASDAIPNTKHSSPIVVLAINTDNNLSCYLDGCSPTVPNAEGPTSDVLYNSPAYISVSSVCDAIEVSQHLRSSDLGKQIGLDIIQSHQPVETQADQGPMTNEQSDKMDQALQRYDAVNDFLQDPVRLLDHFCPTHGHVVVTVPTGCIDTIKPSVPQLIADHMDMKEKTAVQHSQLTCATTELQARNSPSLSNTTVVPKNDTSVSHASPKCDTVLREPRTHNRNKRLSSPNKSCSPLSQRLRNERLAIKLNTVTCALSIALWAPYVTATLAHLLLSATRYSHLVSVHTLMHFKWLSYTSSFAYAIGCAAVDRQLLTVALHSLRFRRLAYRT
ncbi:unnamed protein product [Dicrocoelium dendriticum]|nr:unnamed protein product [Dicrocoelium dendriticum]